MVLPGGVAGDVARAIRHSRGDRTVQAGSAALAVVLERAAGQVAFAVLAVGGVLVWIAGGRTELPGWTVVAILIVPGTLAAGWILVRVGGQSSGRWGGRWGGRWLGRRVRRAARAFGPALRASFGTPRAALVQAGVSLGIAASYVAVFTLCGAAIGAPLPPAGIATLVPLALLSMLVPVTVGGWGLREGAAAVLWPLVGLTAAEGTATAALYGLVSLAGALPGVLVPLVSRRA